MGGNAGNLIRKFDGNGEENESKWERACEWEKTGNKKPIPADLECIVHTIIKSYCVFKVGDVYCIMASMIRVVV